MLPAAHFAQGLPLVLSALIAAVSAVGTGPAHAGETTREGADPARYAACMTLAREDPEAGFDSALTWEGLGGGNPARHCIAVALIGLGHHAEGASRLENLAETLTPSTLSLRSEILAQSGQAWLLAGNLERAHAVQSIALQFDPDNPELLVDRSITLASAENYGEALEDLNAAEGLAPDRVDILIYRASAYRFLDQEDLALKDVERALMLEPNNPFALLERGILRRLSGDDAGARADWLRVTTLAEEQPVADMARANLEKLDVKVE